jgi:hypothetical protein
MVPRNLNKINKLLCLWKPNKTNNGEYVKIVFWGNGQKYDIDEWNINNFQRIK